MERAFNEKSFAYPWEVFKYLLVSKKPRNTEMNVESSSNGSEEFTGGKMITIKMINDI